MERTHSTFELLDLPTEIRLMIFSYPLQDFRGDLTTVEDLLYSCRQVNYDITAELTKVFNSNLFRVIDAIIAAWNKSFDAPLHIKHTAERELEVGIPNSPLAFNLSAGDEPNDYLGGIMAVLHPLLTFRFKKLVFTLYDDKAGIDTDIYPVFQDLCDMLFKAKLKPCSSPIYDDALIPCSSVLVNEIELTWRNVESRDHMHSALEVGLLYGWANEAQGVDLGNSLFELEGFEECTNREPYRALWTRV